MTHSRLLIFSLLLLLLILLATFFSLAETALMAVNRYRLRHKARMKKRHAIQLLHLLKRPDRLLGAILIGNNFANMLASSLATLLAYHFWGDRGAILAAMILTLIVLIFAEITPKTLAAMYPDRIAKWVVYPTQFFLKLLYPLVWLVNSISNGLLRIMHINVMQSAIEPLSREELRSIVYDTTGKISRQYQNMLLGILDLNKLTVDDVLIPRHEIIGIDIDQPWENVVQQIQKSYQDWIPVYHQDINQLVGILCLRELVQIVFTSTIINKEKLLSLLQDPYFVPQGTSLYAQLAHFQQSQDKIAFVVDEYGEIQGMLTLNDILEEIVGDFTGSLLPHKRIQKQDDESYLVDGAVTIREFNRHTQWELPTTGPRTVNGLIIEYLEALPHSASMVLIADYPIEIIHVKDNRVRVAKIFPKLKREKSD